MRGYVLWSQRIGRFQEKLIGMYELGKVELKDVWEKYSALVPEELEDLAQSLEMMDILSRINALRERLAEIDQKKNPIPAKDVPTSGLSILVNREAAEWK